MLSLIDRGAEAAGVAVDELIRSRALVLDEMATRGRVRYLEKKARDACEQRSTLPSSAWRISSSEAHPTKALRSIRPCWPMCAVRRKWRSAALAEHSADARAELSRAALGIEDVQRALPSGAALLSFVRYRRTISTLVGAGPS